jgi:glycosyltransferase involved in cell wall biosynthesis
METQLAHLILGLADRGYRVTVVARTCNLPGHRNVRWLRVPGPLRPLSIGYLWFALAASIQVARARPGLVHTTGAIVLNRAHLSTVHLCHRALRDHLSSERVSRHNSAYRVNAWIASKWSLLGELFCYRPEVTSRLVAVSASTASELSRYFPRMRSRVHVIPNGVDADRFARDEHARLHVRSALGLSRADLLAIFVGSEWSQKGLSYAISGVAAAAPWHLCVVGEGDLERYSALARDLQAGRRVHFVGRQEDPSRWYSASDAFILPSAYESFSLVSFEAAAAGLPILATRVGAIPEVLDDGRNGWFIRRDAGDISQRLRLLGRQEELRASMGAISAEKARGHSWSAVVTAYEELYRTFRSAAEAIV